MGQAKGTKNSKNIPAVRIPQPKNPNRMLLDRKPESETVVGMVSKRLASAIVGGKWNDGGR